MNENYLRYLFGTQNPYSNFGEYAFEMDADELWGRIKQHLENTKPEDISFLKKEGIKSMEFVKPKNMLTINLEMMEMMTSEEMEYFRQRLLESLRVPTGYFDNNLTHYIDEYH